MPKTRTAAYQTAQARLQTTPRALVRFLMPRAIGTGLADPFSRDFSSGTILVATRTPYPYLGKLAGNTQTVDHRTGTSSQGTFTIELVDKGGLITAYCSDAAQLLQGALGAGGVTAIQAQGSVGGYPDQGTLELVAASGTKERIRYSSLDKPGQRFLGTIRGVDGTATQAWPASTILHNGEQIRAGTRVEIRVGYDDVAEDQFLLLGTFQVLERSLRPDRVTWVVTCADVQRLALVQVFSGASDKSPVVLGPEHPAVTALKVLISTGNGTNGIYDVLGTLNGAGIDAALIDVAAFEALRDTVAPRQQLQFSITGAREALGFVRTQCLAPLGAVLWVNGKGQLSAKRFVLEATPADSVATLDQSNILAWTWEAGDRQTINVIGVLYDLDTDPLLPGGYATGNQYRAGTSIRLYGRRQELSLVFDGLRTSLGAQSFLDTFASRIFQRWADPAPVIKVEVQYRTAHHLEIGDVVAVTHTEIPNLISGIRGLSGELMQVLDTRPQFGGEGRMILTLGTMVRMPAPSGDVFSRTVSSLVPATILTAPENFTASQLETRVILTWKAVTSAQGYEIREGGTWEGAKVIAADWSGVSFVVENVLDGSHTYRIRAFTKSAAGVKTLGPESTAILSTSGNDAVRNIVIDRDEVALAFPGTKTGVQFFSELIPPALSNMAALWFDKIPIRWFGDAAISGLWFRHAGNYLYETPSIDLGKLETTAVVLTLLPRVTDIGWFDSYVSRWFNTFLQDWFDAVTSAATLTLEMSLSEDGVAFGAFQPYVDGVSYRFRAIKFRLTITPQSESALARIETMRMVFDVPDVIKELKDFAVPVAGATVSFAAQGLTFVGVPFVAVTHKGGLINKAHVIENLTVTGFDIKLRDKTDALVAGSVDIRIQGF